MTRDIKERFDTFNVSNVTIRRCALNIDQVRLFNPPPSPAKITDSRAKSYIEKFGHDSWELDAMAPATLQHLASENIQEFIDYNLWQRIKEEQRFNKESIRDLINHLPQ